MVPRALNSEVSPSNNQFTFILSNGQDQLHGLTLHLLVLPGGKDKTITVLTSKSTEPGPSESVGDCNFEAARAMAEYDSLAWSPDGSMLAFIGAQQGTSADVYTYIPQSGLINHLTSGPSQAYAPSWSPDGKYIVHFGASTFGTGAGFSMQGAWAVRASDGQVYTLYTLQSSGENLLGWISPTTFVVYSWSQPYGAKLLRTVNILNQKSVVLYAGECIQSAALDPQGAMVWSSASSKQAGVWVKLPGKAAQQIFDQPSSYPRWSPSQDEMLLLPTAPTCMGRTPLIFSR